MLTCANNVRENGVLAAEVNYTAFQAFYTSQFYVNSNFQAFVLPLKVTQLKAMKHSMCSH